MKCPLRPGYYVYGHSTPGHFLPNLGGLAPLARRKDSFEFCLSATMCTDTVPRRYLPDFAFRPSARQHGLKKATTDKLPLAKTKYTQRP